MKFRRTLVLICSFGLGLAISLDAQNDQSKRDSAEDDKIRVAVDEVRLDAVVLDSHGHQITDLTTADFEIYQDERRQEITYCAYISEEQKNGLSRGSKPASQASVSTLNRENVHRTIAFIVDNITMSFKQVYRARMALRKFVEDQMLPGDLVAILSTSGGNASHLIFTQDKKPLLEIIDNLKWYIDPRVIRSSLPQYPAILFAIQALKDMPGRKSLMLIATQTLIPTNPFIKSLDQPISPIIDSAAFTKALNQMADQALRAGVVIHTLDIFGLIYGDGPDEDAHLDDELKENKIPLSQKTGGVFISENNFFINGLGAANEEIKGYYLLSYIPPPDTYGQKSSEIYRRIKIKVKRPGSIVHHRDGFFGTSRPTDMKAEHRDTLADALFSPFQHSELMVDLTAGFIEDPQKGYMVQSSFHLDGKELSLQEKNGETHVTVNASVVTTDLSGAIRDTGRNTFSAKFTKGQIASVRKNGLNFLIDVPAKMPGAYYIRVAVQDKSSGRLGSAYQYIEIPELKNGRLSLSSIFAKAHESYRAQSAALRNYVPGESFDFSAVVYNATFKKKQLPDLQFHYVLYRNGDEFARSSPEAVALEGIKDYKRIPIQKTISIDTSMQSGEYVLQLTVEDRSADKKYNVTSQALGFKVVDK